jgi:hypothetical protein
MAVPMVEISREEQYSAIQCLLSEGIKTTEMYGSMTIYVSQRKVYK